MEFKIGYIYLRMKTTPYDKNKDFAGRSLHKGRNSGNGYMPRMRAENVSSQVRERGHHVTSSVQTVQELYRS